MDNSMIAVRITVYPCGKKINVDSYFTSKKITYIQIFKKSYIQINSSQIKDLKAKN